MDEAPQSDSSSSDATNKNDGQLCRPSFSMASTLAMVRKRQEEQRLKVQHDERAAIENRKELARAKRRRRRQNQRLAKATAKSGLSNESNEIPESVSERAIGDGISNNLERPRESSPVSITTTTSQSSTQQEPCSMLPLKKRIKARVELENPSDVDSRASKIEKTSEIDPTNYKYNLGFKLIPRALLVKRPEGDR